MLGWALLVGWASVKAAERPLKCLRAAFVPGAAAPSCGVEVSGAGHAAEARGARWCMRAHNLKLQLGDGFRSSPLGARPSGCGAARQVSV